MPDDYWRDRDEYRRRKRRQMVRCLGCGRLIFPSEVCMDCDTPGPESLRNANLLREENSSE